MKALVVVMLFCSFLSAQVKVIFDTDMNGDVDDIGAIAMLHTLAERGEAEILACMTSNPGTMVCECVDAINTWYGRPDIPIGAVLGSSGNGQYTEQIALLYSHDITRKTAEDPVTLYRKILAQEPDSSVTIITVGYLPNIAGLLRSTADEFSDLDGIPLIEKKVKEWVCMGGVFPAGSEYNLTDQFAEDAVFAIDNWPGRIIFTGFEIGKNIFCCKKVHKFFTSSPVKKAYQLFDCDWAFDGNPYNAWEHGHYSWDPTAVLVAIRGIAPYWNSVGVGYCYMNADGTNEWRTDIDKDHLYLTPKMSNEEIGAEMHALADASPVGAFIVKKASAGWLPFSAEFDSRLCNPGYGNTIQNLQWDLGDGSNADGQQVVHEYTSAGRYMIKLDMSTSADISFQAVDSVLVSDPIFSDDPVYGNALNYERMNENLWSSREYLGDIRYYVNDANRNSDVDFDGYSMIKNSESSEFTFAVDVAPGFDLEENRTATYKFIFGYQDNENYAYIQIRSGSSSVYAYQNGTRVRVGKLDGNPLPDTDFHTFYLTQDGSSFHMYMDGQDIFSSSDSLLQRPGAIMFGSDGYAMYFDNISLVNHATQVSEHLTVPGQFKLYQNSPNPFNPSTMLRFQLIEKGSASLSIFNLYGQKIQTFNLSDFTSGVHEIEWDGTNELGQDVSSGVYFVQLTTPKKQQSIKISLIH